MIERNNPTGWLSPQGIFYPCARTEHAEKAIELCGSQEAAFQSGWLACLNWDVACGFGISLIPAMFFLPILDKKYLLHIKNNKSLLIIFRMKKNCDERRSIFFEEDGMNYPNKVEKQHFTLISALDKVLEGARRSTLNDNFWRTNNQPIEFLSEQLEMTKMQVVFLAILIEFGEPMSWKKFGDCLKCSKLSVMVYSDEMEDLVKKRWVIHRIAREGFANCEGFALVPGVVTALRKNEVFVPEKIDGLSEQEFVNKLERHLEKNIRDINYEFKYDEELK